MSSQIIYSMITDAIINTTDVMLLPYVKIFTKFLLPLNSATVADLNS